MFGLFKKKSEKEKLAEQYKVLMEESFKLSSTDRQASDQKRSEAEEIAKRMDAIKE